MDASINVDLEFWPNDQLAIMFDYIRIPANPISHEPDGDSDSGRHSSQPKHRFVLIREEDLGDIKTFSSRQGSPQRSLKEFLRDQRHFLKAKELHLQKLRRRNRDLKKEVWPYKPAINPISNHLFQDLHRKTNPQQAAMSKLKSRLVMSKSPKPTAKHSKVTEPVSTDLKEEVKAAAPFQSRSDFLDLSSLGHLLIELGIIQSENSEYLKQIWAKLNTDGHVKLAPLIAFLLQSDICSSQYEGRSCTKAS